MQSPRQRFIFDRMILNPRTCVAFTGHRTYRGETGDALSRTLEELCARGFRTFVSGMAVGFDLAAAEAVLALRERCPEVRLVAAVPFPGQARHFPHKERARYERVLAAELVREKLLRLLDKEIPRLKDKIQSVQLCFSTDPFMYQYPEIQKMSLASIKKLNEAGIKCSVLTKGILPIELAEFSTENEYGITLITTNEAFRKRMEPGSAPWKKRLAALRALHDAGCKTWVSIEPFPTPNIVRQDLQVLLEEVSFVDRIIFGRMNYSTKVTA